MSETGKHTQGSLQIVEVKTLSGGDHWHVYLADQNGRKIAALWGEQEEKSPMPTYLLPRLTCTRAAPS